MMREPEHTFKFDKLLVNPEEAERIKTALVQNNLQDVAEKVEACDYVEAGKMLAVNTRDQRRMLLEPHSMKEVH